MLVPHLKGISMLRELEVRRRFAMIRSVMHIGGFRSFKKEKQESPSSTSQAEPLDMPADSTVVTP